MKVRNALRKIGLLSSTTLFLVAAGCGDAKKDDFKGAAKEVKDSNPFGETAQQNLPPAQQTGGSGGGLDAFNFDRNAVRNYEELKSSIAVVTCISDDDRPNSNNSMTYGQFFQSISGNLPTTNDPEKYISANIVGSMNLASYACMLSVRLNSAAQCQWSAGIRGEDDPDAAFTDDRITDLGKSIEEHFWGMDATAIGDDSDYITDLKGTVSTLQADIEEHLSDTGVNQNDRGRLIVEGVLVSLCSAALSSSFFTTY